MEYKFPVYQPFLSGNEKKYVVECLESSWISSKGKFVNLFEAKFNEFIGSAFSTTVSNGTVALHLALLALDIKEGDEIIVPTFTYIASVNAIKYCGAIPVFVDSLESNWQIDPADVKRKITSKTKAILCVHLYGHACDMDALTKIAQENSLYLVEDCAEALGTKYKNKFVGTFGDVATFSFYGNKTVTTGEGGMVSTNDEKLYNKLIHLKGQGSDKNKEYWHDIIGYNYRMTNIAAAIGLAQLERAHEIIERKRAVAALYKKKLDRHGIIFHQEDENVFHSYWMCSILINNKNDRDGLRAHLANNGVETRPLFYPIHTMPMYELKDVKFKVADNISSRGINLPSYPSLSDGDVEFISETILAYFDLKDENIK
jgi:perosamine synthetase